MTLKDTKIAVIGLGYVGLPIAVEFSKKYPVVGYDINEAKIASLQKNIDPSKEMDTAELVAADILYTCDQAKLKTSNCYIVAVPTPVDENKVPDLTYLRSACEVVGQVLSQGDYAIFESTVYPGCTEEVCIPILEKLSGLTHNKEFKVGYSPERINPGDKVRKITDVIKVVSGSDAEALTYVSALYASIIKAGVSEASSLKVAEAAKIVENTQRNINIALMNELTMIFDKLGINTSEVLAAAGTKWNFHHYYPGLVGGHCIDVDPYYLTYKAELLGHNPEIILAGKRINSQIPSFIAKKIVHQLLKKGKVLSKSNVLIKGITYKENVSDHRNSKVIDLHRELVAYSLTVDVSDPLADKEAIKMNYDINMISQITERYDVIIYAVAHRQYLEESWAECKKQLKPDPILFDVYDICKWEDVDPEAVILSL